MNDVILTECNDSTYIMILSLLSRKTVFFPSSIDINDIPVYIKAISPESKLVESNEGIKFIPGPLEGGKLKLTVDLIPDALDSLLVISPFLNEDLNLELTGITNYDENSTDLYKITYYKIFKAFQLPLFDLSIKKRGFSPLGEGTVILKTKFIRKISPINLNAIESISKIRGFVISSRIGSNIAQRMISNIKNDTSDLANTKILCIVNNRNDSGPSPGYECSILGESKNGVIYKTVNDKSVPETMAKKCCIDFLKNIKNCGIFDEKLLPNVILLMGLAEGVSDLAIGKPDEGLLGCLKLLKLFFNISYKIDKNEKIYVLTIFGCGYTNPFASM